MVDVPDFPVPGVLFRDLTPVFADPRASAGWWRGLPCRRTAIRGRRRSRERRSGFDVVVGVEARGFLLAAAVAIGRRGVVPVRKAGKLPRGRPVDYALEYGTATLELHADALRPGPAGPPRRRRPGDGRHAGALSVTLIEQLGAVVTAISVVSSWPP